MSGNDGKRIDDLAEMLTDAGVFEALENAGLQGWDAVDGKTDEELQAVSENINKSTIPLLREMSVLVRASEYPEEEPEEPPEEVIPEEEPEEEPEDLPEEEDEAPLPLPPEFRDEERPPSYPIFE